MRLLRTLLLAAATLGSSHASILLYNQNAAADRANAALDGLGLTYTQANASNFNTLLTGSTWDLVVLDIPSTLPTGGFGDLVDYVGGGGKALISFWNLQDEAALAAAFEVQQVSSFFLTPAVSIWDPSHPIFNNPNSIAPFPIWENEWADKGDRLDPVGAAVALAGFTPSPTADEAAIVLGNNGRTLYNGFLWDNFTDPTNGTNLIANQIDFLLKSSEVPEPSTCLLFGSGLVALVVARRRRTVS